MISDKTHNRRVLSFTKRADIFFTETEISMFKSFRIFVFIAPDDSGCSTNTSRKSFNEKKKISFEFKKLENQSYAVPTALMMIFLTTPCLLFLPIVINIIKNSRKLAPSQSNLISFSPVPSEQRDMDLSHDEQQNTSSELENNGEIPAAENQIVEEITAENQETSVEEGNREIQVKIPLKQGKFSENKKGA